MKLTKFLVILLANILLFNHSACAKIHFTIKNWQENSTLTKDGKISSVLLKGKVSGLQQDESLTTFSISFDAERNIKMTKVTSDARPVDYTFNNNSLMVKFQKTKPNNDPVLITFSYEEKYPQINEFLRQEVISIPSFAAGADAEVIMHFPEYLQSVTFNPNVTTNANSFTYKSIVPQNGVQEKIKLTPSNNIWDVNIKVKISSNHSLDGMIVQVPNYFRNAQQNVKNYSTSATPNPSKEAADFSSKYFKFNSDQKAALIESKAKICLGKNHQMPIARNSQDYLQIDPEEAKLLMPIVNQIKQNPKYNGFPLYAKIGQFVYDSMKYDESYVGKLPSLKEILQNHIGVCTEYSRLYTALARTANIPALSVDGAACGEYSKCQGHSWNLVYYHNRWIHVDPTWDLMSGTVSSSHIYFNDRDQGKVSLEYPDDGRAVDSKIDFEMKQVVN